jgi:hypothetical protein
MPLLLSRSLIPSLEASAHPHLPRGTWFQQLFHSSVSVLNHSLQPQSEPRHDPHKPLVFLYQSSLKSGLCLPLLLCALWNLLELGPIVTTLLSHIG